MKMIQQFSKPIALLTLLLGCLFIGRNEIKAQNTLDKLGLSSSYVSPASFSLRKLSSDYAGNAIKVRRSSDNTTQDIGFTSNGDLDTASLKTFVGANNGFVTIWYDQSGNARNATQATTTLQPQIVAAGVVNRKNNVPTLVFAAQYLTTPSFTGYPSAFSLAIAAGVSTNTGSQDFGAKSNSNIPAPWDFLGTASSSNGVLGNGTNYTGLLSYSLNTGINATTGFAQWVFTGSSSSSSAYINGAANGSGGASGYTDVGTPLVIGSRGDHLTQLNGWMSEYVTLNSVLSATDRATVVTNQTAYTINKAISFTTQPSTTNLIVNAYTNPTPLTVAATGGTYTYQWYANTAASNVGGTIMTGYQSSSLYLPTTTAGVQYYYCVVGNGYGYATSNVSGSVTVLNNMASLGLDNTLVSPAAFSLRQLGNVYKGSAIQVRRSSDNTTANIGFTGSGDLDTTALKTFVGSGNGFVSIWYDQSGFDRHATQATTTLQPQIVTSGVVNRKNNVPTLVFASQWLSTPSFTGYPTAFSLAIVAGVSSNIGYQDFGGKTGLTDKNTPGPWDNTNSTAGVDNGNSNGQKYTGLLTYTLTNGQTAATGFAQWIYTANSAGAAAYINGTTNGSGGSSAYGDAGAPLYIGTRGDIVTQLNGWMSEYVTLNTVLSSADKANVENKQGAYYLIITKQPSAIAQSVCLGGTVTDLSVSTLSNIGYQWYSNTVASNVGGTLIAGATSNTYSPVVTNVGTLYYYCVVTSSSGSNTSSVSGAITVTANVTPSVTISANTTNIISGTSVTFTATPTNGGAAPTYQWQKGGTNISGATAATYTYAPLNGDVITCILTANNSCQTVAKDTSNPITVTVSTPTPSNALNVNAANSYIAVPYNASFIMPNHTVELWIKPTYSSLAYNVCLVANRNASSANWAYHINGTYTALLYWNGSKLLTYNYTFSTNTWYHVAFVQSGTSLTAYVNGTSIGVQTVSPSGTTGYPLTIGGDLANEAFIGNIQDVRIWNKALTSTEIGTYQCPLSLPQTGLLAYYPLNQGTASGSNAAITTAIDVTGNGYNGTLTNFALSGSTSNWVAANGGFGPSVTIAAVPAGAICSGTAVTYTATPTNGGTAPTYQWFNGSTAISGATATTYTYTPTNNDSISVLLTNTTTCAVPATATSAVTVASVTTGTPFTPSVSIVTSNQFISAGTSVTFTANAANVQGTPSYQWKKNGTNVGSNSATYTDGALANNDAISVVVTSSNPCALATATSNSIVESVCPVYTPSNITTSGSSCSAFSGQTLAPNGTLNGAPKWTYTGSFTFNLYWDGTKWLYAQSGYSVGYYNTNGSITNLPSTGWIYNGGGNCSGSLILSGSVGSLTTALPTAIISGTATACGTVSLTASGGSSYIWNGGSDSLAALNTFTNSGTYMVRAIAANGCTATTSKVVTISPQVTPSVSIVASQSGAINTGTSVTFTASPTNGGTTPTYKWIKSGFYIVGATSSTYTYSPANGDLISVEMTANNSCQTVATVVSNTLTETVNAIAPTFGTLSLPAVSNQSAPFTLSDPTSNSAGAFTYTVSNTSVATITGNTVSIVGVGTATITATQAANGNYTSGTVTSLLTVQSCSYVPTSIVATGAGCSWANLTYFPTGLKNGVQSWGSQGALSIYWDGSKWVYSFSGTVYFQNTTGSATFFPSTGWTATPIAGCSAPTLFTGGVGSLGNLVTASISGTATACDIVTLTASGGTSYSWNGGNNGTTSATNDFTKPGTNTYKVVVSNAIGCKDSASQVVTILGPSVTPQVSMYPTPGNIICGGTSVTFATNKVYGGTAPTYNFKVNGISVQNSAATTYTSSNFNDGDVVSCELTANNTCQTTATATSNTIPMTVTPNVTPTISIVANSTFPITAGNSVTFTATPTNGGTAPTYQWLKNGSNISGATALTYTYSPANGDIISVLITNTTTCSNNKTVQSNEITASVLASVTNPTIGTLSLPTVTTQSAPFTLTAPTSNSAGTFTYTSSNTAVATISGTTVTIIGAGTSTITATQAANGSYTSGTVTAVLTITNCGNVGSPSIVITSSNQFIYSGTSVTFTATTKNIQGTASYQWKKNGINVGTNSSSYTDTSLVNNDSIKVVVTSSNSCGVVTLTSNSITESVCTTFKTSDIAIVTKCDFFKNSIILKPYGNGALYDGAPIWQGLDDVKRHYRLGWELGKWVCSIIELGATKYFTNSTGSRTFLPSTGWVRGPSVGCDSSFTLTGGVGSLVTPTPTVSISGNAIDSSIVSLSASGGNSYIWSGGLDSLSATNTFNTSGTYTVRAIGTNGCTAIASQLVTITHLGPLNLPQVNTQSAPFVLKDPNSQSPGSFTYTSSNTSVATISGKTVTIIGEGTSTITATQAASGIYSSNSVSAVLSVVNCFNGTPGNVVVSGFTGKQIPANGTYTPSGLVSGYQSWTLMLSANGKAKSIIAYESKSKSWALTYWRGDGSYYRRFNDNAFNPKTLPSSGWFYCTLSGAVDNSTFVYSTPSVIASITGTPTSCNSVSLIASGGSKYIWSGGSDSLSSSNTFTKSGTYTVSAIAANGCTGTASKVVTVKQPTKDTITQVAVGSYSWHGTTYTQSGTYTFDTINAVGCDSLTTLKLSVTPIIILDNAGIGTSYSSPASFSLRKLSSNYTNAAIQVRRSSDESKKDIGFTSNGDLDTAALKSFVGTNDGFVSIWYDQSGNGRNATQANTYEQPQIVTAGVVNRKNNIPTLIFTNNQYLATQSYTGYPDAFTLAIVAGVSSDAGSQDFGGKTGPTDSNIPGPWDNWGSTAYVDNGSSNGGTYEGLLSYGLTSGQTAATGFAQWTFTANSSMAAAYINGVANGTGGASGYGDAGAPLFIGTRNDHATQLNGWMSEYITLNTIFPDTIRQALEANQVGYYSIAIAPSIDALSLPTVNSQAAPFILTDPKSNSAGSFTYTSSDTTVATVSGNTVTIVGGGTATITATQAANGAYASGSVSAVLTVQSCSTPIYNNVTILGNSIISGTYVYNGLVEGRNSWVSSDNVHIIAYDPYVNNGFWSIYDVGGHPLYTTSAVNNTQSASLPTDGWIYQFGDYETFSISGGTATGTSSKLVNAAISGNAKGCESVILTASGGDTYTWSDGTTTPDITISTSGTYQVKVSNATGCKDSATQVVVVNQPNYITIYQVAIDSFTWHGTTYTESNAYYFDTLNAGGCDSTTQLILQINHFAPASFGYNTPDTFTVGKPIATLSPSPVATGTLTSIATGFGNPQGMAVDAIGNVFVADAQNNQVNKIAPDGTVSTIATGFDNPRCVAVDTSGNVYVTSFGSVSKIATDGFITPIGSGYATPNAINIENYDSDGSLIVADALNSAIHIVAPDGSTTSSITTFSSPQFVTTDVVGNFFVVDGNGGSDFVIKMNLANSNKLDTLCKLNFASITGLAIDAGDNVYITRKDKPVVTKITPSGVSSDISYPGFYHLTGITVDAAGNIYVANWGDILKVSADGGVVSSYSIIPALPTGLDFNTNTGVISGTPTVANAATDYTVTASNGSGSATSVVNITVNEACSPTTARIFVTACGSYTWHGKTYTNTNPFPTLQNYTFDTTNAAGCDSLTTLFLTLNQLPNPTISVINTQCGATTLEVFSFGKNKYNWNGGSTPTSLDNTFSSGGTAKVVLTNSFGCVDSASFTFSVIQPSTATLSASACGSYTWYGTTYSTSGTYTKTGLTNAAGCDSTATLELTITPCTNTWTGVTSTDWNNASNWSAGVVPTASTDAIIANNVRKPVVNSTANVKNLTIGIGASLTVSGTLNVSGNWVNNGVPALSGNGTVVLQSSTAATLSGYTLFNNLEVAGNYSVGPLAADNLLVDSIAVTGILKKTSGTLTTNGKVTLKSTASKTALIQEGGGTLSGKINMERYIGGANGYHHISSPVTNNTVGNWGKYFSIVGVNNIATSAAGSKIATLQEYRESSNKKSILDSGFYHFTNPSAITTSGKGLTAWLARVPATLVSTGTPANGNINVSVTFAATNATTKGWNLIGNPYPSPISWSALRSLNPGVWGDQACYIWKATSGVNGQWQTYNGTVGTNGVGNVIASTQGFFVLVNQSTNITFNNSIRTADLNPTFFSTGQLKQLRLQIVNPANLAETDEVVAYTKAGIATPVASVKPPMPAEATNASLSFVHEGKQAAIEALADFKAGDELALNVSTPVAGVYLLKVGEYNNNLPAYLKDAKTGNYTELKAGAEIAIATEATTSNTRYSVVFGRPAAAVAANNAYKVFTAKKTIQVTNAVAVSNAKVVVYNTLGQQIATATMNGTRLSIPVSASNNATYVVKIACETVAKVIVP